MYCKVPYRTVRYGTVHPYWYGSVPVRYHAVRYRTVRRRHSSTVNNQITLRMTKENFEFRIWNSNPIQGLYYYGTVRYNRELSQTSSRNEFSYKYCSVPYESVLSYGTSRIRKNTYKGLSFLQYRAMLILFFGLGSGLVPERRRAGGK